MGYIISICFVKGCDHSRQEFNSRIFILNRFLEVLALALQQLHLLSISVSSPLVPIHILVSTFACKPWMYNVVASGTQVAKCPFLITRMRFHFTASLAYHKNILPPFLVFLSWNIWQFLRSCMSWVNSWPFRLTNVQKLFRIREKLFWVIFFLQQ